jgi:hypothetical protein
MVEINGITLPTGWHNDPAEVQAATRLIAAQGHELQLSKAAPNLFEADADNASVFLWEAEEAVLGRLLPCWNQNPVGSCVGFGFTRAAQDCLLNEIMAGEPEVWPGAELAPEVTYIGSRVEVNGGRSPIQPSRRNREGDGSVGAWAAKFLMDYGVVKRGIYGSTDLTKYSPQWVRANQFRGLPDEIEAEARLRPIKTVAQMASADDVWAALGARKPVPFCFVMGFRFGVDQFGYSIPGGEDWAHCETLRGRFMHPRFGRSFIRQNSWVNPDGSVTWPGPNRVTVETVDRGPVLLPYGCAGIRADLIHSFCRQRETYALAGLSGWKKLTVTMQPYG